MNNLSIVEATLAITVQKSSYRTGRPSLHKLVYRVHLPLAIRIGNVLYKSVTRKAKVRMYFVVNLSLAANSTLNMSRSALFHSPCY